MIDSICVIISALRGEHRCELGLRMSRATLLSALDTKVVFLDEGVYSAVENHEHCPDPVVRELVSHGQDVYCARESLEARRLSPADVYPGVRIIDESRVPEVVSRCESAVCF